MCHVGGGVLPCTLVGAGAFLPVSLMVNNPNPMLMRTLCLPSLVCPHVWVNAGCPPRCLASRCQGGRWRALALRYGVCTMAMCCPS